MTPIAVLRMASGGSSGGSGVQLNDLMIRNIGNGTSTITGTYTFGSDGKIYNQTGAAVQTWLLSGTSSSYQVEAVLSSGVTPSGTLGSWLPASSSQSWSVSCPTNQTCSSVITVYIRDAAAPNTVRASASITFDIENFQ